jgi:hypothetical protein
MEVKMEVIDLTSNTPAGVVELSRGGYAPILLVLHDTAGSTQFPDRNDLDLAATGYAYREQATIKWFQGGGGLSIHYLIGPEATGAKIYRLAKESWVAYHAGGSPGFPSSWTDPYTHKYWAGVLQGVGALNVISIGIERWGAANEPAGPKQTASMLWLAGDIATRLHLKPLQIVAHKELEGDRQDGGVLLGQVRALVAGGAVVQDDFNPNPAGFSVGAGMLAKLKERRLVAGSNEQYYSPNPGQSHGLAQRSYLWSTTGEQVEAFQDLDKDANPAPTWKVRVLREI